MVFSASKLSCSPILTDFLYSNAVKPTQLPLYPTSKFRYTKVPQDKTQQPSWITSDLHQLKQLVQVCVELCWQMSPRRGVRIWPALLCLPAPTPPCSAHPVPPTLLASLLTPERPYLLQWKALVHPFVVLFAVCTICVAFTTVAKCIMLMECTFHCDNVTIGYSHYS